MVTIDEFITPTLYLPHLLHPHSQNPLHVLRGQVTMGQGYIKGPDCFLRWQESDESKPWRFQNRVTSYKIDQIIYRFLTNKMPPSFVPWSSQTSSSSSLACCSAVRLTRFHVESPCRQGQLWPFHPSPRRNKTNHYILLQLVKGCYRSLQTVTNYLNP